MGFEKGAEGLKSGKTIAANLLLFRFGIVCRLVCLLWISAAARQPVLSENGSTGRVSTRVGLKSAI
jgi:hypothetical protein